MFPRPPGKNATGKLKLVIKPRAEVEVETSDTANAPVQPGTDDNILQFKLPTGFTLDTDIAQVNSRQRSEATQRVKDVEDRLNKCKPCRKRPAPDSIPNAHLVINNVFDAFSEERVDPITIVVGHQADDSFKIDFTFKSYSANFIIVVGNKFYMTYSTNGMPMENHSSDDIKGASEGVIKWLKQVP
jgi:hypothetical protein